MSDQYSLTYACDKGDLQTVKSLIQGGMDPNKENTFGHLALSVAARKGTLECVQLLLDLGANPNVVESADSMSYNPGRSPLAGAAENGHLQVVELLLSAGAVVETEEDRSPLALAAENGHLEILQLIAAAGVDLNRQQGWRQRTALGDAAEMWQSATVECLLALGADPTIGDRDDDLPLSQFCGNSGVACNVIEKMVAAGAEVNQKGQFGRPALHQGAHWGGPNTVETLLALGADPNILDDSEQSALHHGCEGSSADEVVPLLIKVGAAVDLVDDEGSRPLHLACKNEDAGTATVTALLDGGAQINSADGDGQSPLQLTFWLMYRNNELQAQKASLLLERGASPAGVFESAARLGNVAVVGQLLALEVNDSQTPDEWGKTPLHWAAYDGNTDVVALLVKAGFGLDIVDEDGSTPLHFACQEQHVETALVLLQANAAIVANNKERSPLFYAYDETRAALLEALPELAQCLGSELDEVREGLNCVERGDPDDGCPACKWTPSKERRLHCPWCGKHGVSNSDYEVLHGNPYTPASDTEVRFGYTCEHCGLVFHTHFNVFAMASPGLTEDETGASWQSEDDGVKWRRMWSIWD
ncbi:MAG: hypothetical protein HN348_08420 [Proteobacteria bacterium]|jgi:ankyrin repeat protein|nr:hypothetical protein [Pseudomonadota bacterium]